MIGQTVSHYKITEKLGEGGMGVVYKARDTKLDRTVALKFLPPHLTQSKEDKQRFTREAKSAAALNHPNICTIYSVDEYEERQFISMEYIDGETLREKIDRGDLTQKKALDYAVRIADALGKAHHNDIIHRDIKPENIMVNADGHIKVMDFGLAKLKQGRDITKTGDTVGTLAYMSPEQIRGQQVDHRSDIFSLGIVLYEMLTGSKPFQGEHQAAMTYSIVNEEPEPLSNYMPEAPKKLTQIIDRLLAKDPEHRMDSAAEVAELLDDVKESYDMSPESTRPEQAGSEIKEPSSGSDSSTISITLPALGFGKKKIGWPGLLASVTVMLALVLFAGWWFAGGNEVENKDVAIQDGNASKITDRSIAVLPFNSVSSSNNPLPLADGLHYDLLTRLENVSDLKVISRTSVEKFQRSNLALPAIADSLGVNWIMEGGVQQIQDKVSINVQLIDPQSDTQIWADTYKRNLTAKDLFDVQGEIAREIAGALQAELTAEEEKRIGRAPTQNLEAYQLYLKGRKLFHKATNNEEELQAISYFRQALEQDSTFALAWTGLADAIGKGLYEAFSPDSLNLPDVTQQEAARRALELDPDLAEAHTSMGIFYMGNGDGPAAVKKFLKAIDLKPNYWEAHNRLGEFYLKTGRPKEALEHLKFAVELNPQHRRARHFLYDAYLINGKAEKSLETARQQQKMGLEESAAVGGEVRALYKLGRYKEARELAKEQIASNESGSSWSNWFRAYLVSIHATEGDTTTARKYIDQIQANNPRPEQLAQSYITIGEVDKGIEYYQKVPPEYWKGIGPSAELRYGVSYNNKPIRNDPRYQDLIRKANKVWGLNPDGSIPEEKETM